DDALDLALVVDERVGQTTVTRVDPNGRVHGGPPLCSAAVFETVGSTRSLACPSAAAPGSAAPNAAEPGDRDRPTGQSAAPLAPEWPDGYSWWFGVASAGFQPGSVTWIAVIGRQKLYAFFASHTAIVESASATLRRAKMRAFWVIDRDPRKTRESAARFQ